jgi:hypothetical protein
MVATDWGPVVQTSIGAAAAIGGGTVVAWMQRRGQERMDQQRRRERASETIAAAWQLHIDSAPDRLALEREEPDAARLVAELIQRHDALRLQLFMLAVWYPSEKVRSLALEAANSTYGSFNASVQYIRGRLEKPGENHDPNEAEREYQEATDRLGDLLRVLQRE